MGHRVDRRSATRITPRRGFAGFSVGHPCRPMRPWQRRSSRPPDASQAPRSCWLAEHERTARRDHLADRASANNEEHCEARRHQGQLQGERRHRPMNVSGLGKDCEGTKNSDMILKRNLALVACQHAQVEAIYNRFNDANSNDALDAKQYNRGIERDKTPNRQGDASPSCRRGPPQCTYNGVCRLFSGLDERDDEECWDVGCRLGELAVADKVDDFPSYERKNDARARNGDLHRGPSASSYLEARMRIASFLERLSPKVMADRIAERHQEAVIEARMAQNANRMQTDRACE